MQQFIGHLHVPTLYIYIIYVYVYMYTHIYSCNGYTFVEFILSPEQFGIPNSRPRYYLLAVRKASNDTSSLWEALARTQSRDVCYSPLDASGASGNNETDVATATSLSEHRNIQYTIPTSCEGSITAAAMATANTAAEGCQFARL